MDDSIIELMALIGAEATEDRFGKLAAFLYVLTVIILGIATVLAFAIWVPWLVGY